MFDTMTLTKTAGAFCGALLIFLLGNWAAESIYSMGGGHGEDHAQGYVIDTGGDEAEEEVEDEGPDLAALFAEADASKGERVFNKCKACHVLEDGANGVGPHLYDVVGREVGSVDGFGYSGALSEAADVWGAEELFAFLENPAGYAPGTSMGFAGLGKPEDRANVIAYLDQSDGETDISIEASAEAPAEEAAAEEAPAEEAATEEAPAEEAPAEEAPAEEAASEEAPAEETAAEEAPAEEAATEEEAAAEETAAEEAPAEEAATEEAATEEAATEETESADAGGSEFAAMVAAADAGNGEKLYRRCQACHKLEDGANGVGPHLYGVVDREIAGVDGFNYSDALKGIDGAWTLDQLSAWIENPREFAPGNRMGFAGLKDEQDRADLMAYLQTIGN
ncbi:MAG: cytochrome c family protein [Roseovarius sp.]|uniref:c-type cytochrome n=1 Tax=Roseovarius sp. TaxID=1486281 RepID=UPI0032F07F44